MLLLLMTFLMHKVDPSILCAPNIIKPLHWLNPRTIKGTARWNKERQRVYAENNYHCMACGVEKSKAKRHKWLEAHEVYTIDFNKHTYRLEKIVPLCPYCHNFLHTGRLYSLYKRWIISNVRYNAIINHWNAILAKAKLNRMDYITKLCWWNFSLFSPETNGTRAEWWLVLDGKKYKTKFKTYREWSSYYNH